MNTPNPQQPSDGGASTIVEPSICPGCGILAQPADEKCDSCGTAYTSPPQRALSQPGGGFWVGVQATFTCNACRFDSPLNHFERDDGVQCTKCGLEQKYDRGNWRDLVDFAHQVGDFGSGGPQGRFPDSEVEVDAPRNFAQLATSRTPWAGEKHRKATPGNPLCRECKAPVVVKSRNGDVLEVACSKCNDTRQYERPSTAERIKQLAGTLADENEKGAREVVFEEAAGVVVIACPNCAAPLENVKHSDGVMICRYCNAPCRISTQSHARAGHKDTPAKTWWLYFDQPSPERKKRLNQGRQARASAQKKKQRAEDRARSTDGQAQRGESPRAARSPDARAKKAQRKALIPLVSALVVAPILYVLIVVKPFDGDGSGVELTEKAKRSEAVLKEFSFQMSSSETSKLLGAPADGHMTVKFAETGVVKEAQVTRAGTGSGPSFGITIRGGNNFDLAAAIDRLAELAPNRFQKKAHTHEINVAKSLLRVDPRTRYIQVDTWLRDERAIELADALWAAARYAAYGKPKPTKQQLRLINGPQLKDAAKLDVGVRIEKASKSFAKKFPHGACDSITNINTKKTQLVCKVEVDHPLLAELYVAWPNGEKASVEAVTFKLAKRKGGANASNAVGKCLDGALGEGEKIVTDHASGAGKRAWKLGKAGDQVVLDDNTVSIAPPEKHEPTQKPGWTKHFADVVEALDGCKG